MMKNIKVMKKRQSPLDELLSEITPEEQEKTDVKMQLAAKISDNMAAKGWNNKMLMKALGKKPEDVDVVVISHIHADHTGGLAAFLEENSNVEVFLPASFPASLKEETAHKYFISVVASNNSKVPSPAVVNEQEKSYAYFDQTIYS